MGNLVVLMTGDRVPTDLRVINRVELSVDKSLLMGENRLVGKTGAALDFPGGACGPPLTEQRNVAIMGMLVVADRGRGLVMAVGRHTEFVKFAKELGEVESRCLPLQVKINKLSRLLVYALSVGILVMALVGYLLGIPSSRP
jgi:Ca2+-transporting ATPase